MGQQNATPFRSRDQVDPLFLRAFSSFGRPSRLLDLGCNTGTEITYAAKHGWTAVGCDVDAEAIAIANRKFATERVANVSAYHLTIQDCLDQTTSTFDLVTSLDVLSFLPPEDMPGVLERIGQIVKPGGEVLFRVFTTLESTVAHDRRKTFFSDGQLADAFPNFTIITDEQKVLEDPGHVGRPEPHTHHVEIFHAKKR